jgi:tryptophan-rich sensory protein
MKINNKNYFSLVLWTVSLIAIGMVIGYLTKSEIATWYNTLNRSPLTPPNYVFPIVWTILYAIIGFCGWLIWQASWFPQLNLVKSLYITQLLLNWSWSPLFFSYHLIDISMLTILIMDILVSMIMYLTYSKIRTVALLMVPYLAWLLFATYLNFYIWLYN